MKINSIIIITLLNLGILTFNLLWLSEVYLTLSICISLISLVVSCYVAPVAAFVGALVAIAVAINIINTPAAFVFIIATLAAVSAGGFKLIMEKEK